MPLSTPKWLCRSLLVGRLTFPTPSFNFANAPITLFEETVEIRVDKLDQSYRFLVNLPVNEEPTTAAIQRYLNALPQGKDAVADAIVRELLERSVNRLRLLCSALLYRGYPRLTSPPLNLETDELLGGVVAALLRAMRTVRPQTVRQFFALATQQMRWQLNDMARRLDKEPVATALSEGTVPVQPPSSASVLTPEARRIWQAIDELPEEEREAFDLIRIQGLTQAEAAGVIGVSIRTVQRKLNRALLLLAARLADLQAAGSGDCAPLSETAPIKAPTEPGGDRKAPRGTHDAGQP